MTSANKIQQRIDNQTRLLVKLIYASSLLSLFLCLFCFYFLDIRGYIPYIFFGFSTLNVLNLLAFKKHGRLVLASVVSAALSLIGTTVVTLFSGGIQSPFIFILAIIVLGGYISARIFGEIYLILIVVVVIAIYTITEVNINFITNEVPKTSRDTFSLISLLFSVYILGGVFGRDILKAHNALKTSKGEIEKRIDEKEILLCEVHHRVKNNLQTVSSLLNLQAKNSTNDTIKNLVLSSQNRVNSMAMIHEMLYMRDNLSKIEFRSYVKELTEYLIKSADGKNKNVIINIDIPDIQFDIDTAIPLGLLINEAVTNSLKYGFVEKGNGQIDIKLKKENDSNTYILDISDNGVGFAKELNFRTSKSLGLKLIHNLARQLRGSVKREPMSHGTNYSITFQDIGAPYLAKGNSGSASN